MGIFDKILGKKESESKGATRLGAYRSKEEPVEVEEEKFVPRYQQAKEWREKQADQLPLVERGKYKRRV